MTDTVRVEELVEVAVGLEDTLLVADPDVVPLEVTDALEDPELV